MIIFVNRIFFLQFLVIKTLDPDWIRIGIKWIRIRNTEKHQHMLSQILKKMAGYSHPSPGPCEPGAPWGWRALWSPGSPAAAPPTIITHTYVYKLKLTASICSDLVSDPDFYINSWSCWNWMKLEISMQNKILIIFFYEQNFPLFLKNVYNIVTFKSFVICKDWCKCTYGK